MPIIETKIIDDIKYADNGEKLVESLGGHASIVIPDTVKIICEAAFKNISGLKDITFPDSIEKIEKQAFLNCSELEKVIINQPIALGWYAFYLCTALHEVNINCEEIPPCSFAQIGHDLGGADITLNNTRKIGIQAFNYSKINSLTLPDTLFEIGDGAFEGCEFANETLILPKSVKIIDKDAFSGTNLEDIYVPDGIMTIAFQNTNTKFHMSEETFKKVASKLNKKNIVVENNSIEALLKTMTFKKVNEKYLNELKENTLE